MRINISNPIKNKNISLSISDKNFYKKFLGFKIGDLVNGKAIDKRLKTYILIITGGQDKEGFMLYRNYKSTRRMKKKFSLNQSCINSVYKPKGYSKRRTIRGCLITAEISVLNFIIVNEMKETLFKTQGLSRLPKRLNNFKKFVKISDNTYILKLLYILSFSKKQVYDLVSEARYKNTIFTKWLKSFVMQNVQRISRFN